MCWYIAELERAKRLLQTVMRLDRQA